MHRRVFTESRRARVYAGDPPGTLLPAPRDYEWLELTRRWRDGYQGETWFVADPAANRSCARRWRALANAFLPLAVQLVASTSAAPGRTRWTGTSSTTPGWFLEEGWALTPETAGIAQRDGWGPQRKPSIGWVRRRPAETLMMIGGRNLGAGPAARVIVSVDNRPLATLDVAPGFFLRVRQRPGWRVGRGGAVRAADGKSGGAGRRRRSTRGNRTVQPAGCRSHAVRVRRWVVRTGVQPADSPVVAVDERACGHQGAERRAAAT